MKKPSPASPVSYEVNVARLPRSGLPVVFEADEAARAKLAEAHDLLSVEAFRVDLLVTAWNKGGARVTGTVVADITQACVVTLEPLAARLSAEVSALFLPESSRLGRQLPQGEMLLDPEGPDGPETFSGETVDVGALAEEFFDLEIDPYPRKPGVEIDVAAEEKGPQEGEGPADDDWHNRLRGLLDKS
jgi:hypothetical protein